MSQRKIIIALSHWNIYTIHVQCTHTQISEFEMKSTRRKQWHDDNDDVDGDDNYITQNLYHTNFQKINQLFDIETNVIAQGLGR